MIKFITFLGSQLQFSLIPLLKWLYRNLLRSHPIQNLKINSFIIKIILNLLASTILSTYICTEQNKKIMRTTNYSELRNNLKSYLDRVINDSEPLIVHRSGNESVVVISLEEYNSIKETEYIMKSPAMMDIVRKGDEEIKNGGGTSVDINNLWK